MIECVVNIVEGRDLALIAAIAARAGSTCLDVHTDRWHNRSVLTLAGPDTLDATIEIARATLELGTYRPHEGVHPSIGVLDVVPFVPLGPAGCGPAIDLSAAVADRDAFIAVAGRDLALPCFAYGPERSLPEIRRRAVSSTSHPTVVPGILIRPPAARASVPGRRSSPTTSTSPGRISPSPVRSPPSSAPPSCALGFAVGSEVQVSCNLIAPWEFGPADALDAVAERTAVDHTELVGLIPDAALQAVPRARWAECDLAPEQTIEARLA